MNFEIKRIAYQPTTHYPYNYRVEFGKCTREELSQVRAWAEEQKIPCCFTGFTLYLTDKYATIFQMRWA